jgi:antitoxin component YwqK of YwqJK toxin-antitoxin module
MTESKKGKVKKTYYDFWHRHLATSESYNTNGEKDGECLYYDKSGKLIKKENCKNGELDGECAYYSDGEGGVRKEVIKTYKNGRLNGKYKVLEFGRVVVEGCYIDDKKEGRWVSRNGYQKIIETYKDDRLHGKYGVYEYSSIYECNDTLEEGYYVNGEKEGVWLSRKGWKKVIATYKNGRLNGDYYEEGCCKGTYKNDKRDGEWMFFAGDYITTVVYDNGVEVSSKDTPKLRFGRLSDHCCHNDCSSYSRAEVKVSGGLLISEAEINRIGYNEYVRGR